jgi:type I pantothenate kinase
MSSQHFEHKGTVFALSEQDPAATIIDGSAQAILHLGQLLQKALLAQQVLGQPMVVQISGAVAAGKTTLAQQIADVLQSLVPHWQIQTLSTDHFLQKNAWLEQNGGLARKGFPDSYDHALIGQFFSTYMAGKPCPPLPYYSHARYDHDPDKQQIILPSDVLIVEGVIALNRQCVPCHGVGVFLQAEAQLLETWYLQRFMDLRAHAAENEHSYFRHFLKLTDAQAKQTAIEIWQRINWPNWLTHICNTVDAAHFVITKGASHQWQRVQVPGRPT